MKLETMESLDGTTRLWQLEQGCELRDEVLQDLTRRIGRLQTRVPVEDLAQRIVHEQIEQVEQVRQQLRLEGLLL